MAILWGLLFFTALVCANEIFTLAVLALGGILFLIWVLLEAARHEDERGLGVCRDWRA